MSDIPSIGGFAVVPCNDIEAGKRFWERLGFTAEMDDGYKIMVGWGCEVHLQDAVPGWLKKGENPFGVYLRTPEVDAIYARAADIALGPPADQPWGMYEIAFSDPDETLVKVGWPSRLRGTP